MRLILMRHAQTISQGRWVRSDAARYLTAAGRRHARRAGASLSAAGEQPLLFLSSPLTRAVQTTELMAREMIDADVIETSAALEPGARLSTFIEALNELEADACIVAVGHEPQMSEWSAQLLGTPRPPRAYYPGTVLVLQFNGRAEPGRAKAVTHYGPDGLEAL